MHTGGHVLNATQFWVVTLMFEKHLAASRGRLLRAAETAGCVLPPGSAAL